MALAELVVVMSDLELALPPQRAVVHLPVLEQALDVNFVQKGRQPSFSLVVLVVLVLQDGLGDHP